LKSILDNPGGKTLRRAAFVLGASCLAVLLATPPAQAHAFGARYDLPLPLWLYLAGAGVAVVLSFVVMTMFFRTPPANAERRQIDLLQFRPMRILSHPVAIGLLQTVSLGVFLLILAAGFWGTDDALRNFAPTFVWIIWWVGFSYVAALATNFWPIVNPWSIVYAGFERLARLCGGRGRLDLGLAYPSWLGVWPAVALFWLFAWFELVYEEATLPEILATLIIVYSALAWLGMAAFGRDTWLARGEAFSLAFGVFGRFAPIGRDGGDGRWYLRPFASALIVDRPCHRSMTAFVLLMLSTVTFDGFKETPAWSSFLRWAALKRSYHSLRLTLHDAGIDFLLFVETEMLVLIPIVFFLVYKVFSRFTAMASGSERPDSEIGGLFVFSLVPIAIAYHLAHYLSYVLVAGQQIIPLASDPLGLGWDLFGTADYQVDISVIGAKFVWYTAVVAIVAGHVIAVAVAHFVALRVFASARAALRSQYPLLVLMVGYTVVSLWILSQPIVESPGIASFRSPSGVLSLARRKFGEVCLDMAENDTIRYQFRADQPVTFDIHYHDGRRVQKPVHVNKVAEKSDSFVAGEDQSYCLMWTSLAITRTTVFYQVTRP